MLKSEVEYLRSKLSEYQGMKSERGGAAVHQMHSQAHCQETFSTSHSTVHKLTPILLDENSNLLGNINHGSNKPTNHNMVHNTLGSHEAKNLIKEICHIYNLKSTSVLLEAIKKTDQVMRNVYKYIFI